MQSGPSGGRGEGGVGGVGGSVSNRLVRLSGEVEFCQDPVMFLPNCLRRSGMLRFSASGRNSAMVRCRAQVAGLQSAAR